jgi:hypothetical protein
MVHPADIQDRDGGVLVMATLFGIFPFLKTLFADSGYQGPKFAKGLAKKILPHLDVEIVKRSDQVGGFVVLPKRWIVERTIASLNRCRRLAKDWECLNRKALAFLRLASIIRRSTALVQDRVAFGGVPLSRHCRTEVPLTGGLAVSPLWERCTSSAMACRRALPRQSNGGR